MTPMITMEKLQRSANVSIRNPSFPGEAVHPLVDALSGSFDHQYYNTFGRNMQEKHSFRQRKSASPWTSPRRGVLVFFSATIWLGLLCLYLLPCFSVLVLRSHLGDQAVDVRGCHIDVGSILALTGVHILLDQVGTMSGPEENDLTFTARPVA